MCKRDYEISQFCKMFGLIKSACVKEDRNVLCVHVDFSVRELLKDSTWVKGICKLSKEHDLRVCYSDGVYNNISSEGYKEIYNRGINLEKQYCYAYLNEAFVKYKSIRRISLECKDNYNDILSLCNDCLYKIMMFMLQMKIEGYGVSSSSLTSIYMDAEEFVKAPEFLQRNLAYIEYIRNIHRYSDFIHDDNAIDFTSDEIVRLVREIAEYCCNCINFVL